MSLTERFAADISLEYSLIDRIPDQTSTRRGTVDLVHAVESRTGAGGEGLAAVDGAMRRRPFLLPVLDLDIVVVSRQRKDACLYDLPGPRDPHRRGPHPIYGKNKIALAKRARIGRAGRRITYHCRGAEVTRQYKDVPRDLAIS